MARRSAQSIEAVTQASTVMTRNLRDLSRELITLAEGTSPSQRERARCHVSVPFDPGTHCTSVRVLARQSPAHAGEHAAGGGSLHPHE
jgi:hypothetical protein